MKILAIDTSSSNASVAILEDENKILELNNNEEKTHSQKLMPMITELFVQSHNSLDNIDLISCCVGPGSFTGIRIGISTAKAFCDSKDIISTSVNSLEALAYNINFPIVCSIIDAKNENVFFAIFNKQENMYVPIYSPSFCSINYVYDIILNNINEPIAIVSDNHFDKILSLPNISSYNIFEASSFNVGKCGYFKYKQNNYGNSSFLTPLYLKKSQAEINFEQKNYNNLKI